jgi:hypothetical protein
MNTTRIINLLRAYFVENKKMLLICCIISFGVFAFLHTIVAAPELSIFLPPLIMFWVAGTFFQYSLKRNNSTHFFNLPVTAAEKFVHAILVLAVCSVAIRLLAIAGAYVGYYVIHPLLNTDIDTNRWIWCGKPSIWEQYRMYFKEFTHAYLMPLSIFLFGSIYFKKNAFWKTIVSGIGFMFGYVLYVFALLFIAFGTIKPRFNTGIHSFNTVIDMPPNTLFLQEHYYIIPIALAVFFLSLTYLRIRETEV